MSHWSTIKEKSCGYWPMLLLLKIYKIFGKSALRICIYPVVLVFHTISAPTRAISAQYLNRVKALNPGSIATVNYASTFRHIFSFADALVDKIIAWSGNLPLDIISIKTQPVYSEFLERLNDGQGAFLICSHLGNMEVFRALGRVNADNILSQPLRINAIMQIGHTDNFNRLMRRLNPDVTTNIISALDVGVDTIIDLKGRLAAGELVVTSGDRTAARNQDKRVTVDFLGDKASFPQGSFVLASLVETPVYYLFLLKETTGTYSLYLYKSSVNFQGSRKERNAKIAEAVLEYAGHLQTLALKYPYQWYNFFDFWKS